MRLMRGVTEETDWDKVENSLTRAWYFVAKITGYVSDGSSPAHTCDALLEQIMEDPEYKKKEEEF